MDQFVSALILIFALVSVISGVNGLPSLRRDGKTKHSFQEIVVFGDSVSDNGLSKALPSLKI
jgi:energy-converting hydrogenase Eha subunit A